MLYQHWSVSNSWQLCRACRVGEAVTWDVTPEFKPKPCLSSDDDLGWMVNFPEPLYPLRCWLLLCHVIKFGVMVLFNHGKNIGQRNAFMAESVYITVDHKAQSKAGREARMMSKKGSPCQDLLPWARLHLLKILQPLKIVPKAKEEALKQ